jgi:hypothetical protein
MVYARKLESFRIQASEYWHRFPRKTADTSPRATLQGRDKAEARPARRTAHHMVPGFTLADSGAALANLEPVDFGDSRRNSAKSANEVVGNEQLSPKQPREEKEDRLLRVVRVDRGRNHRCDARRALGRIVLTARRRRPDAGARSGRIGSWPSCLVFRNVGRKTGA